MMLCRKGTRLTSFTLVRIQRIHHGSVMGPSAGQNRLLGSSSLARLTGGEPDLTPARRLERVPSGPADEARSYLSCHS